MQVISRPIPPAQASVPVSQPSHRGLFAKWEMINGKLTCQWLKNPD